MLFALIPDIWNPRLLQYYFRFAIAIFFTLFLFYRIWFPTKVATTPGMRFNSVSGVSGHFYNGINLCETQQVSDACCWIINTLFGA
jgi:hypothetical protein